MCQEFGPPVEIWATFYGNCFQNGLVRNILVMMTSTMTSKTLSDHHNPAKKTDIFRKKFAYWQLLQFCICVVPETASAYLLRQHLRQGDGATCGRSPEIFQTSTLSTQLPLVGEGTLKQFRG